MAVAAPVKMSRNCGIVYRAYIAKCAIYYTDFWEAYEHAIPRKRHKTVGKETGQTNHIERSNCTLRQRISILVRKTLSFSKKQENHVVAIKYFIWNFNLALLLQHHRL